ncbi:MAG: hypothetical protein ACYC67_19900 [Prosthecobacter sp.]
MTTEEAGKRITFVAGAMSALVVAIAGLRFLLSGLPLDRFGQAVFLVASAWILVAGLMRLFTSGMLFVSSVVFDTFEGAMPSAAGFFDFLRRAYGVCIELFLVASMFYLILTGLAVAFGWTSLSI